jgi:dienelactone hydrolase
MNTYEAYEKYEQTKEKCQRAADRAAFAADFFKTQQRNNDFETSEEEQTSQYKTFAEAATEFQTAFAEYKKAKAEFFES